MNDIAMFVGYVVLGLSAGIGVLYVLAQLTLHLLERLGTHFAVVRQLTTSVLALKSVEAQRRASLDRQGWHLVWMRVFGFKAAWSSDRVRLAADDHFEPTFVRDDDD